MPAGVLPHQFHCEQSTVYSDFFLDFGLIISFGKASLVSFDFKMFMRVECQCFINHDIFSISAHFES